MNLRTIGNDFTAAAIGFGCMGLSQGYGATDEATAIGTIRAALDAGVTMLDTAMSYGGGDNERLVGRALREHGVDRAHVQIATKLGIVRTQSGVGLDADPDKIAAWCNASLSRLRTDYIDLYYLHRVDPRIPVEDSVAAMADLVTAGKVRRLGVSEVTADQLRRAHAVHPITAVQLEWSLMWREPEAIVLPEARRLGIGIVPYSPLGRGLLGGRADAAAIEASPFRSCDPRYDGESLQANRAQADALAHLATQWGHTPAQVALAWLLAQGDDVLPIPGSRSPDRARENAAAMDLRLSNDQLELLERTVPSHRWAGDRRSFAVPVTARPAATQSQA